MLARLPPPQPALLALRNIQAHPAHPWPFRGVALMPLSADSRPRSRASSKADWPDLGAKLQGQATLCVQFRQGACSLLPRRPCPLRPRHVSATLHAASLHPQTIIRAMMANHRDPNNHNHQDHRRTTAMTTTTKGREETTTTTRRPRGDPARDMCFRI